MSSTTPPVTRSLADLARNTPDESGYTIHDIYARKPPEYVVYRTDQKVAVQFADIAAKAGEQRKMMSSLNPLRGKINGLIDGWRLHKPGSSKKRKAERFERRVADSLISALEGDVESARTLLEEIKRDILDERIAWARFQYLLVALACGLASILLTIFGIGLPAHSALAPVSNDLIWASSAGAVGAFFSIALAIRGRTVLPDLQWIANDMDAGLRMLIGIIAAVVLMAMVDAHLVNVTFGSRVPGTAPAVPADAGLLWLEVLITGFVAGFSERFVPDLLSKASATTPTTEPAQVPRKDIPNAAAGGAAKDDKKADTAKPSDDRGADDAPPPDPDAHADDCACGSPLDTQQATLDEHLPVASGGVALPDSPQA